MRQFETGATRDTDRGKYDYEAFLSPQVLRRYAAYMHEKRTQHDGTLRDGDNWQKMFGEDHESVCLKSLLRHTMDLWLQHRGVNTGEDVQDTLCAIMFNAQAYLFSLLLKDRGGHGQEQA